jgi:hypothetical protein
VPGRPGDELRCAIASRAAELWRNLAILGAMLSILAVLLCNRSKRAAQSYKSCNTELNRVHSAAEYCADLKLAGSRSCGGCNVAQHEDKMQGAAGQDEQVKDAVESEDVGKRVRALRAVDDGAHSVTEATEQQV